MNSIWGALIGGGVTALINACVLAYFLGGMRSDVNNVVDRLDRHVDWNNGELAKLRGTDENLWSHVGDLEKGMAGIDARCKANHGD